VLVSIHPPVGQITHDFIPNWPAHSNLSNVMLLIIGLVAPPLLRQLFFHQSYVVDKRITRVS